MAVHPCPWTPAILEAIAPIIEAWQLPVHDPFAGTGERLGQLCDRLHLPFTGTEIEPEFVVDLRVDPGDSTLPLTYPARPFAVVTSPVYPNGMADHFRAGDTSRRHTYRQALATILGHDRPLHPNNMGRWGNRFRASQRKEDTHFDLARRCVVHWPAHVVVNVKDVKTNSYEVEVVARWRDLLTDAGYAIVNEVEVSTPGQRFGANGHARADHEVVLVAESRASDQGERG